MQKPKTEKRGGTQRDRFIEAAKELGGDEDEETFKAKLALIARQKPKDELEPSKDKKE